MTFQSAIGSPTIEDFKNCNCATAVPFPKHHQNTVVIRAFEVRKKIFLTIFSIHRGNFDTTLGSSRMRKSVEEPKL